MEKVTSTEFRNNAGLYAEKALTAPVTITRHGREALVLLSKEQFDRINTLDLPSAPLPSAKQVLDTLKSHEADLRDMGIKKIGVFGSIARGDANENSDIDLFAELDRKKRISLVDYVGMVDQLKEVFGRPVDLVQCPAKKAYMREAIEKEGILAF